MGWIADAGGFFIAPFKSLTAKGAGVTEEFRNASGFWALMIAGD